MDEDFYRTLLDRIADGVYFVDTQRHITYWNAGAEHITGYTASEVVGHSCSEGILRHVSESGKQLCIDGCPLRAVMLDGKSRSANVFLHHKDGQRIPVCVEGHPLHDDMGSIIGSVEVFTKRIISQYDSTEDSTRDITGLDPVVRLPTRSFGEKMLTTLVDPDDVRVHGLLFIDVDHFKNVNDTYGHRVGDQVLKMVGQSMANALNKGDIPIRWGGEEFIAILPDCSPDTLHQTAERVRVLIENSWIQKDPTTQVRVTASIGATLTQPQERYESALDRADALMYDSKHNGRNRITSSEGAVHSEGHSPILGTAAPWEMEQYKDLPLINT